MLIDEDVRVECFRPPAVEELTEDERRDLRSTLTVAVDSWTGADEVGLHVAGLHRHDSREVGKRGGGDVWLCMRAIPLALRLTKQTAAALLCASLGAPAPEEPAPALTEIDLQLLETWAGRALRELAGALGAGQAGAIERRHDAPEPLADEAVVADLTAAASRDAGAVVMGGALARPSDSKPTVTLGDHPQSLMHATVSAHAAIPTAPVPVPDLLSLDVGDVLLLGDRERMETHVIAGSAAIAAGRPGARAGLRAVRITGGVTSEDGDTMGDAADGY